MKRILLFASVLLTSSVFAQIPTDSLKAYYPFNGNANDESGNLNHGAVNGASLTTDRFGNPNAAYDFNGTNDFIELPNIIPVFKGSMSYWYKTNGSSEGQVLVYHTNTVDNGFGSSHSNVIESHTAIANAGGTLSNYYVFDNGSGISHRDTLSEVEVGKWYHVVVSYDMQDSARMYIDGVLVNTLNLSSETGVNLPTTTQIGKTTLNNRYFNGVFDDFRVYNRVLDSESVIALYNEGLCYETITVTDTLLINTVITGYNPITYNNTIKVYPNPTNDQITIDNGNLNSMAGYSIEIKNSIGQSMFQSQINQQQFTMNLSNWTGSGLYFLYLTDPNQNLVDVKKIVLQ